jgi:hypothetical protein
MQFGIYKHCAPTERLGRRSVRLCLSFHLAAGFLICAFSSLPSRAQQLSRDQWGGMPVTVSHQNGNWVIAGRHRRVTLNDRNLAMTIETASAKWSTVASTPQDMLVKNGTEQIAVGLAQASRIDIVPYDAGFKTGLKLSLSG